MARLIGLTRSCNLPDFQLVDPKAFSRANRQKMHEKDDHPIMQFEVGFQSCGSLRDQVMGLASTG
ncbi:hypothetical protein PQR70_13925 [Paraburkholderia madseniana]|uniref:hypothetical protein n=1 Tax=Paraburkholderia madseniana TaxID=2599607 RepID=UPI0038BDC01F